MEHQDDPYSRTLATIRRRLADLEQTQRWLGEEVAAIEGRAEPYKQASVSEWLQGKSRPSPTQLIAIEKALGMRAGSLTRPLGFVPAETTPVSGVRQAIAADPALSEVGRRTLIAAYEQLADHGGDRP